jgi:hypothetical protein
MILLYQSSHVVGLVARPAHQCVLSYGCLHLLMPKHYPSAHDVARVETRHYALLMMDNRHLFIYGVLVISGLARRFH